MDARAITSEEKGEIVLADVVLRGPSEHHETYLLAEVSVVVDLEDVRRAARGAQLLQRATGAVLPAVAGLRTTIDAAEDAAEAGVWRVPDGMAEPPTRRPTP